MQLFIVYFSIVTYFWLPLLIIMLIIRFVSKNKKKANVHILFYVITIFSMIALLGCHFIELLLKSINHVIYANPDRTYYYSLESVFKPLIRFGFRPVLWLLPLYVLSIILIHLRKRFVILSSYFTLTSSLLIIGYLCLKSLITQEFLSLASLGIWVPMFLWITWVLFHLEHYFKEY